jgi:hypothetical protein
MLAVHPLKHCEKFSTLIVQDILQKEHDSTLPQKTAK